MIWVIKYLIEASEDFMFFVKIKIGMIDRRLISNPTQAPTHEEAEIEIKVLIIKIRKDDI